MFDATLIPVRRALLSVSDKNGLADLGRGLDALGIELVSTGGSAAALREARVPVREVGDVTTLADTTVMDQIQAGLSG
mgnify:CR=1 FL=1